MPRGPGFLLLHLVVGGVLSVAGVLLAASEGASQRGRACAAAMDCTDAAIRNYEADKRTLEGDQLEAMAAALEVASEALMSLDIDSAREALKLLFRLEEELGLEPAGEGKLAVSGKVKKAPKLADGHQSMGAAICRP